MISATVTLYENCKLTPEKNFVVDEIATYLNTLTKKTATYNFIAHNLNITISANESMGILSYSAAGKYNYAAIQNSNESKPVRYFITDRRFNAQGAVTLTLLMDTLNSFALGTDYAFSENTRTFRQHKDRFSRAFIEEEIMGFVPLPGNITVSVSHELWQIMPLHPDYEVLSISPGLLVAGVTKSNSSTDTIIVNIYGEGALTGFFTLKISARASTVYPLIDDAPEGLNPTLFKQSETNAFNSQNIDTSYLVYETINGKIYCCLYAENFHNINYRLSYAVSWTPNNNNYYIYPAFDYTLWLEYGIDNTLHSIQIPRYSDLAFYCKYENNFLEYGVIKCFDNAPPVTVQHYASANVNHFSIDRYADSYTAPGNIYIKFSELGSLENYRRGDFNRTAGAADTTAACIPLLSEINRYSPNLNKIIALPFIPDLSYFTSESDDNVPMHLIEGGKIINNVNTINVLDDTPIGNGLTLTAARDYNGVDFKLYNSEFFYKKIAYDSFSLQILFEKLKPKITDASIPVSLQSTTTMTSRFFARLSLNNIYKEVDALTEDISGLIYVQRNNEQPIYTSEYLNYLQVGYNYDVKAKERNIRSAKIQVAARTVGAFAQGVQAVASGNFLQAAAGIVSATTSVTGAIESANNQISAAEDSVERKVAELERQTASIGTADDYELCDGYGGTTFKLYEYKANARVISAIDRLFKLYGYKCDEYGVPAVSTRAKWNFLQCDAELSYNNAFIVGLPIEIRNAFVQKFREGVTFLHSMTPDFEQTSINYEKMLEAL